MVMRILIYSGCQIVPMALTLPLVLSRDHGREHPGARLAGWIAVVMIGVYVLRSIAAVLHVGGNVSLVDFNPFQAVLILTLVFLLVTVVVAEFCYRWVEVPAGRWISQRVAAHQKKSAARAQRREQGLDPPGRLVRLLRLRRSRVRSNTDEALVVPEEIGAGTTDQIVSGRAS